MSAPSEKAVQAMRDEIQAYLRDGQVPNADEVAARAHDPALGLDRSVCLRDAEREIVAKVVKGEYPVAYATIKAQVVRDVLRWVGLNIDTATANRIEHEFGSGA